jgi:hypothetical protein
MMEWKRVVNDLPCEQVVPVFAVKLPRMLRNTPLDSRASRSTSERLHTMAVHTYEQARSDTFLCNPLLACSYVWRKSKRERGQRLLSSPQTGHDIPGEGQGQSL